MNAARMLVLIAVALMLSNGQAAAQARGVVIQIPDDMGPGSQRPAPPVQSLTPAGPPAGTAGSTSPGLPAACQGASCAGPSAWHVLNTANKTCLVLSKTDLKGGKDIRKLSTLLPAPLFVVASGACP